MVLQQEETETAKGTEANITVSVQNGVERKAREKRKKKRDEERKEEREEEAEQRRTSDEEPSSKGESCPSSFIFS